MKKITFANKLGYMLGDVANNMSFAMSSSFLLAFYTDVAGISAAAAGVLFLVARFWDAFNDPFMGVLTDRMFARRLRRQRGAPADKFRPFLLQGSWIVIACAILMFFMPSGLTPIQKLVWAYATYILWGMAYTFVNIPYGSLAAVMTQDTTERASLSVARGIGGTVGNLIPRMLVPLILSYFAEDQAKGYLMAMVAMGAIGIVSYVIAYFTVQENIRSTEPPKAREEVRPVEYLRVIGQNRPFISVSVASLAMIFGTMINGAMLIYYFKNNLNAFTLMGVTTIISMVPSLLIAPFLSRLVRRFGIQAVTAVGSLLSAVFFGLTFLLPDNIWLYIVLSFLSTLTMNIPNSLVWGMVSDCIDYNQYLTGNRQEGIIYGTYSFVRKTGQAFAGFLAGLGLDLVGYNADLAVQSAGTLLGIKFLTLGLPAIGMLIAWFAYQFIWNLSAEKKQEVYRRINGDNEGRGAAA